MTTEYILKPGDILYVSIKSMNPEVNILFNPESNMEVSSGMGYQSILPQRSIPYGFEIDNEGKHETSDAWKIKVSAPPSHKLNPLFKKRQTNSQRCDRKS